MHFSTSFEAYSSSRGFEHKDMKSSSLQLVVLSLVVVAAVAVVVTAEDSFPPPKFISWEDFMVNSTDLSLGGAIVVDQNGGGNSTTIQGAIDLVPQCNQARAKIFIYPGIYREIVDIPYSKPYISLIGRANRDGVFPVITNSRKASDRDSYGNELGSTNTATVWVQSDYFVATSLTIENNAIPDGYGDQAAAIRIDGDKSAFYRVRFLGMQDTLLDNNGTHFFYHCHIQGSVDFIWGKATSLYESCVINSTRSGSIATHARDDDEEESGFSFVGCRIQGIGPTILGRAWAKYSRITYSYCTMDDMISPEGWNDWNDPTKHNTTYFGEYMNEGPGSVRSGRVPWSKYLKDDEAMRYMSRAFIKGYDWLKI